MEQSNIPIELIAHHLILLLVNNQFSQCSVTWPTDGGKTANRLDTVLLQTWRKTDSMQQEIKITVQIKIL